jgi:hypothetical protein
MQRLSTHASTLIPALVVLALFLLWAAHDGGYDADTWYWGALVMLALTATTVIALGRQRNRLSRASAIALCALVAYLLWSYLSMAWAEAPGWALEGSNRTLLYVLVFALFLVLPWSAKSALAVLVLFALGIGAIALVALLRMASSDHIAQLAIDGRLVFPTGYFNSSVALFMTGALVSTVLATRRELPGLLRGTLLAAACASLQLAVMGQSRGWLFTLPLVVAISIVLVPDRLRVAVAAALPIAGTALEVHGLLHAFPGTAGASLGHAAAHAGQVSLLISAGVLVIGTLIAWAETAFPVPSLSPTARRRLGAAAIAVVLIGCAGAAVAATHGDPVGFVKRQWHGFSHEPSAASSGGSHFATVGSGRYDFWRVSLDAFLAHPIGGLGQDNFADYYVPRARTYEEPRWTHSLEMRLLAHTGVVGFALFVTFLVAAIAAALPVLRRGSGTARAVAGVALLPLVVWLVHGSVDWFWEIPALSAPALGFLAMAMTFGDAERRTRQPATSGSAMPAWRGRRIVAAAGILIGGLAFLAALVVLTFPYLSVREVSQASNVRQQNPTAALDRLATAARLNPLNPDPGRIGGVIALGTGQYSIAEQRFRQATDREPGGWFAWLGAGLAASALGQPQVAHRDFSTAAAINPRQAAILQSLAAVYSRHPLTSAQAFQLLP